MSSEEFAQVKLMWSCWVGRTPNGGGMVGCENLNSKCATMYCDNDLTMYIDEKMHINIRM